MKKLLHYHITTIVIYLIGILLPLGIILFAKHQLNIDIPIIVLAACAMSCPLVSACFRISIWRKKQKVLPAAVLSSHSARIFFMIIPAEILVFVIGIRLLFS
ncbi:MAG: hypothetical protein E7461_05230 [Ruminococcaceae bacterium]|nr:hypothetical protein [Oscillospiraceae bacterium]